MYNEYYIDKVLASESEIVPKNIRIQILNNLKQSVVSLQVRTEDDVILDALDVHLRLIEDAYNVSMYKFQFKLFTSILNKELVNLEKMVQYEE